MKRNLAEGSILKNILFFSLPYLLSYFLQTLYGMADLFIIGQFDGIDSTTAVSIGSQGYEYDNGNDCRTCYGLNGSNRALRGCRRQKACL